MAHWPAGRSCRFQSNCKDPERGNRSSANGWRTTARTCPPAGRFTIQATAIRMRTCLFLSVRPMGSSALRNYGSNGTTLRPRIKAVRKKVTLGVGGRSGLRTPERVGQRYSTVTYPPTGRLTIAVFAIAAYTTAILSRNSARKFWPSSKKAFGLGWSAALS